MGELEANGRGLGARDSGLLAVVDDRSRGELKESKKDFYIKTGRSQIEGVFREHEPGTLT